LNLAGHCLVGFGEISTQYVSQVHIMIERMFRALFIHGCSTNDTGDDRPICPEVRSQTTELAQRNCGKIDKLSQMFLILINAARPFLPNPTRKKTSERLVENALSAPGS
jgi:hypothetical protein